MRSALPSDQSLPFSCVGCSKPINGGSVVSFGEALFHLNCFSCAKCHQPVDHQSDLLFLTDGRPVCEDCSYVCKRCHRGIGEEAIMTGKDAYHAGCFRCVACSKMIEDLIYTQTSRGIYCTSCHKASKSRPPGPVPDFADRPLPSIPNSDSDMTSSGNQPPKPNSSLSHSSPALSSHHSSSPSPPLKMKSSQTLGIGTISTSLSETTSASYSSSLNDTAVGPLDQPLALPDIPSLNLSFFENDSNDLSNLTQSLGANLSNIGNDTCKSLGKTKINRASEILKSSLDNLSSMVNDGTVDYHASTMNDIPDDVAVLKQKLQETSHRLAVTEANFAALKSASQKALDEFNKGKEEFSKEAGTRQQQEYTILQLRHQLAAIRQTGKTTMNDGGSSLLTEKELDRLAGIKVELEKSCNELKKRRDTLATQIDDQAKGFQAGLEGSVLEQYHLALQDHIKSLMAERDALQDETDKLNKTRDDVIHEMVVLNTKNAELSTMNNDLSRRMTEREREAAAIMAGTAFIHNTPSPSPSTELFQSFSSPTTSSMQRKSSETSSILMQRMTSRDSNTSNSITGSSKKFKLKKPKSNVFTKITSYGASFGNNNYNASSSPPGLAFYGAHENQSLYNFNSTSSINMLEEMKRKGSKQSYDGTTSPGSHCFTPTSFLRPVKCSACGEKIWGATEYRCQGCGSACHGKCVSCLPTLCSATSSNLSLISPTESEVVKSVSIFGSQLALRVNLEERDVPLLVEQCIQAVEARGMEHEGIYRKPGGAAQMRSIQMAFETGELLDLKDEDEINDICAVTSVLKQYLRELPNPLLTFELYDLFMDAVRMPHDEAKIDKFSELISQLPKANYDTMKLLMIHLDNVQKHSEFNLMTTKNLAMVFGPTLLHDKDATRDLLDMSYKNATIEFIINHTPLLFTD
ncbi:hypothetical protein BC941DRAFT_440463 [Chlamydoabsidia padenii]|nr:hypothetical protein BC941DRAFT_440463 [Chlamydoabsidia padenii]